MKSLITSPILMLITTILIVAAIFLLDDNVSLIMTYVIGAAGSFGIIGYFIFHKWNKRKKAGYKTDNINGHNE